MSVTVRQPFVQVAVNGLAGTVTSVNVSTRTRTGDVLYTVDLVPVRAVTGSLPFYRALRSGLTGPDVKQLQQTLAVLGDYSGTPDGRYDAATVAAVQRWERRLGLPRTGRVELGALVAVPSLPAPVRLGEQIVRGARLGGGEPAVLARSGTVEFSLGVSEAQAALIRPEATIAVSHAGRTWPAAIVDSAAAAEGTVKYTLAAPKGGLVCGNACDTLPPREQVSLPAKVTVVPEANGPTIPVAAVRTDPAGATHVLMADGARRDVTVVASAGGLAVVDGLTVGERVLVFGVSPSGSTR